MNPTANISQRILSYSKTQPFRFSKNSTLQGVTVKFQHLRHFPHLTAPLISTLWRAVSTSAGKPPCSRRPGLQQRYVPSSSLLWVFVDYWLTVMITLYVCIALFESFCLYSSDFWKRVFLGIKMKSSSTYIEYWFSIELYK